MVKLLLGLCSWADKELVDTKQFYPADVKSSEERLRYYATQYPLVEVDTTYYAMPTEQTVYQWIERTPPDFTMDVKAFRLFTTHGAQYQVLPPAVRERIPKPRGNLYLKDFPKDVADDLWTMHTNVLRPMQQAGKLGVVLLQFPKWFLPGPESQDHILRCKEHMPDFRLAIEFRAVNWLSERNLERTLAFLEGNGLAYVCVDEPQGFQSSVPPIAYATSDISLVRFHGRNTATWEATGQTASDRFDHWYEKSEFLEWVPKIKKLEEKAQEVHLLINTNRKNQAPVNAAQLRLVLEESGL